MADFIYNVARGRIAELARRVNANDPIDSAFVIVAVNTTQADATLQDLDTLDAVIADASTAEVTNTGYARKVITAITVTVDDTNNRVDLDIADQTWTAVAAGSAWTDLIICYDANTAAGTDVDLVPLSQHDFAVTPDGTDITAQISAAGFFRAA